GRNQIAPVDCGARTRAKEFSGLRVWSCCLSPLQVPKRTNEGRNRVSVQVCERLPARRHRAPSFGF
ncbi:MAG: hypothetical protein AAGH45_11425, partial [Pseudomonadota bacterium]